MQKHSHALLATAVLAAGPVAAAAAEAPLQTLQSQQDIWITNMIQRGHGQYAPGDDKSLRLDSPSTSPSIDKVMTGKAGVSDPLLPLPYSGQRVAVREPVICTDSDPRFAPTYDFVFPIYRQQIWDIGTGNRVRDETDVFFSRRLSDTRPVAWTRQALLGVYLVLCNGARGEAVVDGCASPGTEPRAGSCYGNHPRHRNCRVLL